jgi:orotate phosphoribosyltransferase
MSNILSYLFETNAIKFCKENEPFWYTSGKIGPYFFNSQYVYGGEKESAEFLEYITNELANINDAKADKLDLPKKLFEKVSKQYDNNSIYNDVINQMKEYIEKNIGLDNFEYISGGERRDWYFSIILANLLNKKHLTVFKNMTALVSTPDFSETKNIDDLNGAKVLHLADLITTASSYIKMWVPIINNLNGKMEYSLVVIDRNQNGKENLKNVGVTSHALVTVNMDVFKQALTLGFINQEQFNMITKYFDNPDETMKQFLIEHPEFIENSLKSDNERTLKRVHTLLDENLYGLN